METNPKTVNSQPKQTRSVITLEPPWYRCENGSEFRGMTSKPPEKCPVCKSANIEMVVEINLEPTT